MHPNPASVCCYLQSPSAVAVVAAAGGEGSQVLKQNQNAEGLLARGCRQHSEWPHPIISTSSILSTINQTTKTQLVTMLKQHSRPSRAHNPQWLQSHNPMAATHMDTNYLNQPQYINN